MPERTFSEAQIQALLKRATQLHIQDEGQTPGLTLADLEHIAADAGIPPQYLRAALHESDGQVTPRGGSGHTKTHVFIERVIPGELTDDEWEQVVLRLRKEYANDMADLYGMGPQYGRGVTEELGSTREWRHTTGMGIVTTFSIRSANGKQFINFQRRVGLGSPRAEGLGYGLLLAFLIAGPAGAIAQSGLIFFLALLGAFFAAAPAVEYFDRKWRQKKLNEMQSVADDIAELVQHSEREKAREELKALEEAEASQSSEARLTLGDEVADAETTASTRERTRG